MKIIGIVLLMVVFLSLMLLMNYSVFSIFFRERKFALLVSSGSIFVILLVMVLSNVFGGFVMALLRQFVQFYLGAMFIFFVLSLLFRLLNLYLKTDSKYFGVLLIVVGLMVIVFAIFNSVGFANKNYAIESDRLDRDYKIVHISDIHIGSNSKDYLKKIVDSINTMRDVDAIFLTGDLIDASIGFEDVSAINDLKFPVYFVYGNHEFYTKESNTSQIFSKLNMTILRNKSTNFEGLQIIGFDDKTDLREGFGNVSVNKSKFAILMNHQPKQVDIAKKSGVDLMLSGHTHAGQIWPFRYLVRLQFKYVSGFHDLGGMWLNVNPGTGTWGPKMRLGSKNEISVIELRKK